MNEKEKSIMNRNEAMCKPSSTRGNRIINQSLGKPSQGWIEE